MNYFKDSDNEVFAYDDEQIKQGYSKDLISITEEEMKVLTTYVPTREEEINLQIAEAMKYLVDTDYKVLPDYDKDSTEVKVKRQEAREFIRANEGDN